MTERGKAEDCCHGRRNGHGYGTERFRLRNANFKATYGSQPITRMGLNPKAAQAIKMDALSGQSGHMPDYRALTGVPVKLLLARVVRK